MSSNFVQVEDGEQLAGWTMILEKLVQLLHQSLDLHSVGKLEDLHAEGDALEVFCSAVHKARNKKFTAELKLLPSAQLDIV
jgi:hypothetical protein